MRKKLKLLADQMSAIMTAAEASDDGLTDEQAAEFDKLEAEFSSVKAMVEREDRLSANADYLAQVAPATAQRAAAVAPVAPQGPEAVRKFESFGEFMHSVRFDHNDQRLGEYCQTEKGSAGFAVPAEFLGDLRGEHRMDDGPSGGFAVPTQFSPEVREVAQAPAIVRPRATVIPAGSPPDSAISMPALDQGAAQNMYGGVTVTWVGEGASKPDTSAKLREVRLEPNEVTASTVITDKLLRNWQASGPFLRTLLSKAMAAAEDQEFLTGNGVGKPEGVLSSAAVIAVNRAVADQIAYADLISMEQSLLADATPVWVTTRRAAGQLRAMEDTGGSIIWQDSSVREGLPAMLNGYPVLIGARSPVLGAKGDIALLDLSKYLIKDGSGPFLAASEHVLFQTNKTMIKAFWNVDGRSWLNGTITQENGDVQSPFVSLDIP